MNTIKQLSITLLLLALPATSLFAQEGPYVPCVGCDDFTQATFPESGLWYNPDQSGTGFDLEFQNGIMAGHYFGYDQNGKPEWYLVTSPLTRSEQPDVMWELELQPQRYTGGNCMGCEYQAPEAPELLPAMKIEFLQRAYAKVTLSDGAIQYMVPITYGSLAEAYFDEQTPYLFPVLPDTEPNVWTLLLKKSEHLEEPWNWQSDIYLIEEAEVDSPKAGFVSYTVNGFGPPSAPEVMGVVGYIDCGPDDVSGEVGCVFNANNANDPDNPYSFQIAIGNFTDTQLSGETEDGDTIQGRRLDYN